MNKHTRKLYLAQELKGENGPSIDSPDQNERIAARRIRIENRVAQSKPGYFDGDRESDNEEVDKVSQVSLAQVELSMQRIVNLCRNGNAFITNVRVACDARENLRRQEEGELALIRNHKLSTEEKQANKKFKEITEKWGNTKKITIPHELHDLLEEQKKMCGEMMDHKNRIIYEIHLELKAKDDQYVKELKKRSDGFDLLIERMESQMKSMQRAYTFELQEIERSFLQDRDSLLDLQNADWDAFINEIRKKQEDYLVERKNRILELEDLISKLRTNHTEEFNALKLKLMLEVQQLETDLQQMKSTYQLNMEKLEYNFQVLKRRDEENSFTKSQQKRKITHLQDTLNNIKRRSRKTEDQLKTENETLSVDYKKRMEMFRELQKKSKFLIEAEESNFREIWIMNEDELKREATRLLEADRVITEQQIGLNWKKPNLTFMDNQGPISVKAALSTTKSVAASILKMVNKDDNPLAIIEKRHKKQLPTSLRQVPGFIIQRFLDMLCFEPEFLIEEKVKRLLEVLPLDDQKLIRLDCVLNVLEVHNEEQMDKLFTYFLIPLDATNDLLSERPESNSERPTGHEPFPISIDCIPSNTSKSVSLLLDCESSTLSQHMQASLDTSDSNLVDVCSIRLIEPVNVVTTLNRFVNDFCNGKKIEPVSLVPAATAAVKSVSKVNKESDDEALDTAHWKKYVENICPEDKEKLWSGLLISLIRYEGILKGRANLIVDTDALRVQNSELRHLLQEYLAAKVNEEMELPPITTMHL